MTSTCIANTMAGKSSFLLLTVPGGALRQLPQTTEAVSETLAACPYTKRPVAVQGNSSNCQEMAWGSQQAVGAVLEFHPLVVSAKKTV